MAITQAMATSFKVDILDGTFDFSSGTSQVFKLALVHVVSYARCDYYCVFSDKRSLRHRLQCRRRHADYLSKPCFERHYGVLRLC